MRVVAQRAHAQRARGFRDRGADVAQAHHAERLALELHTAELLLGGLDVLGELILVGLLVRHRPLRALSNAARAQQHAAHGQFLDRVGVGARRVEHADAALGHAVDGDVVDAGAAAGDAAHRFLHLLVLQLVAAQHDRLGIVGVAADLVLPAREAIEPHRADRVVGAQLEEAAVIAQDVDRARKLRTRCHGPCTTEVA